MPIVRKRKTVDSGTGEVLFEDEISVSVVPDEKFLKLYISGEAAGMIAKVKGECLKAFMLIVYSHIEFGSNQVSLTKGRKVKLCGLLGIREWMLWKHIKDMETAGLLIKLEVNSYLVSDKIVTYGKKGKPKNTVGRDEQADSGGATAEGGAPTTEE